MTTTSTHKKNQHTAHTHILQNPQIHTPEVTERAALYLFSYFGPSWPVPGGL